MPDQKNNSWIRYALIVALVALVAFAGGILFERISGEGASGQAAPSQQQSTSSEPAPVGDTEDEQAPTTSPEGEQAPTTSTDVSSAVERDGYYYDVEHVVLYLDAYGELPPNYVSKKEASAAGWSGGSPERYIEGAAIGGDTFRNREGQLPKGPNYTEADIDTQGKSKRGAKRLVFSDDGHYYYTEDHYESFTELIVDDEQVVWL